MSRTPEVAALEMAGVRQYFPGASAQTYLNSAGLGLTSTAASDAVRTALSQLEADPEVINRGPTLADARAACARLVGAEPGQIALAGSTSLALQLAVDAIPLDRNANVVAVSSDFMSVISPWIASCREASAELRVVPHDGGRIHEEDVLARIDERTRAVCISSVQWTSGYRVDLEEIGAACAARGVPFIVDGAQHVGVLALDVGAAAISYLACGGHKWLTSPSAMGFAYVSPDFLRRFEPRFVYAPTSIPPAGTWLDAWTDPGFDPVRRYEAAADAQRFEVGLHHAVLGAAALKASVELLSTVGIETIEKHVLELGRTLAEGLRGLDLALVSPVEPTRMSAITVFRAGMSRDDDLALTAFLRGRGIIVSTRYTSGVGGVRVSPHAYNNLADVKTFLDAVAAWRVEGTRSPQPGRLRDPSRLRR